MRRALRLVLSATLFTASLTPALTPAWAQSQKVKFTLDWRYEAPAAAFLLAQGKGYFDAEKVAITLDSGSGSGVAVSRVASGAYDMGFADLASLMEFQGNNPDAAQKPVGVMMIYNNTPSAIFTLKKSGIRTPQDLIGKTLGAPAGDAARRAFPIFAAANKLPLSQKWNSMDPTLREVMLMRGDVDAVSGFTFYTPLTLMAKGAKEEDITILTYADNGVKLYGNAVIVNEEFAKRNPQAVKSALIAIAKGYRDTIANPAEAVKYLKQKEPLADEKLELARLKYLVTHTLTSADTRAEGFGRVSAPRLALMASQVSDAFNTKARVNPESAFTSAYLPGKAQLDILPK